MAQEMRVQKFLSKAGVCSRRKAEEHMLAGHIKINGKVCKELGTQIDPARDTVEFQGSLVRLPESYVYLLLNKPTNYITSLNDPEGRPVVVDLLPESMPRIWPVGRLDWDSEGLLLMTNDGKLTNLLTHPSHEVPKTYAVKVRGLLNESSPELEMLRKGVEIGPDEVTAPAQVRLIRDNGRNTWLEIVISEGKNRQIRRMLEAIERPVMKLRRISIGPLTIDGIASGTFRSLTQAEVLDLYGEVEAVMPERARLSKRAQKREREAIDRGALPDHRAKKRRNRSK
ncbi:pseudouridine synthase [Lujinxingia litoralis]|uniref:Pseudouridine synthase n=1 Tax=Lujinxingia litoralis TaxID=2211119 RepID=A0A328C9E9_9DELT|nr:pseudouridine synthase [Lujinxingia litoralis]RAL22785.1 pseudouridine synthase [Lujinxingia litoralis]